MMKNQQARDVQIETRKNTNQRIISKVFVISTYFGKLAQLYGAVQQVILLKDLNM